MVRTFSSSSGATISVGENAAENENLCKRAKQNDLWFHLDNAPSPHALLHVEGKSGASREDIHDAQQLTKYYSSLRNAGQAYVIYIEAKWVSGGKEDKTGSVALKKAPTRASVVYNEQTVTRLLGTKS
jgi:predicted ribosome quality control (RQC) complex YloA/Tae2 family protein